MSQVPPSSNNKNPGTASNASATGTTRHVANETEWRAVCTAPDYCRVGKDIIGFDSFALLTTQYTCSSNVIAQYKPVYRMGDLFQNIQSNAGQHIVSGTALGTGYCQILDGQKNVKINGIPVACHDSRCTVNCDASGKGGAPGKLITEKKSVPSQTAASRPMGERMGDEAGRVLSEKWKGLKGAANTVWEALPFTSDTAITDSARGRIGDGVVSTLQGITTLMGPSEEMTQAAYFSGNPEAIKAVETAQGAQLQAVDAIIDHAKQSWSEATARNGTAGASAMVLTSLGTEIAGSKGLGALGNVAGKIAEIARLAKTPLEAASLLDKEITAAKLAKKSADEIKLLEKARDEHLVQARKEAAQPKKTNEGVHVKKGRLAPNASYELNGYKYTTDAEGRIKTAEGNLKLKGAERDEYAQRSVGTNDGRLPDDQGGHLIGSQFEGYGGKENLTPMSKEINNYHSGEWGMMEKNWAERLRAGDTVGVKIEAVYTDGSIRASEFRVIETINGNVRSKLIPNPKG